MKELVAWTLQLVAALGAVGIFWQLWTGYRDRRADRLAMLEVSCRGYADAVVIETAWRGHSLSEGLEISASVMAPSDAVVTLHEAEQKGTASRHASDTLWRPFYMADRLRRDEKVMTRFRVTAPQKLNRVRLKLRLKSTATKRTILTVTRWFSPAP